MPEDCSRSDTRLACQSEAAACNPLPANCPFTKQLRRVLQDAMAAADFWSLPREVRPEGLWLDGYDMIVEARSGTEFTAVRFDNPDVERFWMLGRIAFDLAGLAEVRL